MELGLDGRSPGAGINQNDRMRTVRLVLIGQVSNFSNWSLRQALPSKDGFPLQVREFDQVMGMIAGGQRLLQNEM
ncbi:MAG: hypothetical protein CMN93_08525, partial [Synechococcus sp. CPC35]|nr:hypothetical protein [Synechococcus sp. CPC35]